MHLKLLILIFCCSISIGINHIHSQSDTTKAWVMIDGAFKHMVVDTPATYKEGDRAFLNRLYKVLKYPKNARSNGDEGKVVYTYEVTKEGEIENIQLKQSATHALDSAAKASFLIITKEKGFNPAVLDGKAVRSRNEFLSVFKLQ